MKTKLLSLLALTTLAGLPASGATRYVNLNNPNPEFPYDDFSKAATVIQDAVDAAEAGDLILVTNGVYSTGGRAMGTNRLMNRVLVHKPVTLQSFNGPEVTRIEGFPLTWYTNKWEACRGVYLANGATLSGFTITNSATLLAPDIHTPWGDVYDRSGGGVLCESPAAVITNCNITKNEADYKGGGVYSGTLYNCTLTGNAAFLDGWLGDYMDGAGGGGAFASALNRCVLTGNQAGWGGGGVGGTYYQCTISSNVAHAKYRLAPGGYDYGYWYTPGDGGGVVGGTLTECILRDNSSGGFGGGAYFSTLVRCKVTGNSATNSSGGGVYGGSLMNCILSQNEAKGAGGGAFGATLTNCTVVANLANAGGGVSGSSTYPSTLYNCIVYYNSARSTGDNWWYDSDLRFEYSCTTPRTELVWSAGNITNEPKFVNWNEGDLHLQPESPCINVGLNAVAAGPVDSEGNPRVRGGTVDMGAYESLAVASIAPRFTNIGRPTEGMGLTISGDSGVFEIHSSSNLASWSWLATLTNVNGQVLYTDPAATSHPKRFYRTLQIP